MRLIILFVLCLSSLHAAPKTIIAADNADYDGKKIRMLGAVNIQHEFGDIHCDKGVLLMKEASEKRICPERILLYGAVNVVLQDGSVLTSEEADINCETLEGVFTSAAPMKVVYCTRVEENGKAVPVKTVSRSMRVTMKKVQSDDTKKLEYVIHDIQAEGAVNIEYQLEN